MIDRGAVFMNRGKKISSEEALKMISGDNMKISISTNEKDGRTTVVTIRKN